MHSLIITIPKKKFYLKVMKEMNRCLNVWFYFKNTSSHNKVIALLLTALLTTLFYAVKPIGIALASPINEFLANSGFAIKKPSYELRPTSANI